MNKGTGELIASMKEHAEYILELKADDHQGRDLIDAYDRADTLFGAENVLALIAALEQTRQESKVQLETIANVTELWNEQRQRIAELENDEVRQRLANAEHQLHMAELAKHNLKASRRAQFRKRLAAEKRIAELEAASVKPVKLPAYRNSPDMHTKQYYEAVGFNQGLDACTEAIRAAGGTVEGSD